jgi:hypothetical protein
MFDEDVQKSGGDQRHARVVLVVTDGEQTSGDALATAAEMRDYAGIYVLGIGTPDGAQISYPAWMQRYARVPEDQRTRLSKLDEENLSRLAKENGGAYARATADNADVAFLHGEWEQVRAGPSQRAPVQPGQPLPVALAAAMLCFAAEAVWLALIPWSGAPPARGGEGRRTCVDASPPESARFWRPLRCPPPPTRRASALC